MREIDVSHRVALITGAARGIGLATARALHRRGASVALVDVEAEAIERSASELGDRALALAADVADEGAVAAAVAGAVDQFGGLDIVVANAGITQPARPLAVTDPETFDRVLAVNLHGTVHTARQALPQIRDRGGHIVLVSSVYAFVNGALRSSYAISKAAVEQLGRALRVELAPHGASAGVAYFGFVRTALIEDAEADSPAGRLSRIAPRPMRKRIPPEEAGEAIAAGIEHRTARIIRPRRWALHFHLCGLVNPALDDAAAGNETVRELITEAERGGEGAA